MYPFWDTVINPLIMASKARRIVEIGALRGETTAKMLEDLGPGAELHVIDPLPQFDPAVHEERFGGRYVFHRKLSLDVLGDLPAFDVALIDGDHNWYTVYNELVHLRSSARRDSHPLPICILHDVGWPYGRRDLYYDPANVPEEHRQPFARRGMRPGQSALLKNGGMNITLANALTEGGERNGVRTGLDDFVAEHDKPLRQIVIPIYFGLAIIAEDEFLEAHPEVTALLDRLESPEGTRDLLDLSEEIRLDAVVFEHNIERMRQERLDRAVRRQLELLQRTLLDEHYLENEDRIAYLLSCAEAGTRPDAETLRAPGQARAGKIRNLETARESGTTSTTPATFAYASMGRQHLGKLDEVARRILDDDIPGDLVEIGCGRGGGAIYLRGLLDALEVEDRCVWVVDEFRATPTDRRPNSAALDLRLLQADLNQVRTAFARFDLLDDRVKFVQSRPGEVPDAFGDVALVRLGAPLAGATLATLEAVYPSVVDGGVVLIERGLETAEFDAFRSTHSIEEIERIGSTGVAWRKPAQRGDSNAASSLVRARVPLAPSAPGSVVDLSVVLVFYNMKREAQRTLHSLSRAYQRGIDDVAFEVIVVDNGSAENERLDPAFVESFGPEFRLESLSDAATSSPTTALNHGIRASTGKNVALMIDGAHVLTPGVYRYALAALRANPKTIVATQQWYVGPGQQPDAVTHGYDQATEDRLFAGINWPTDGYRLFEISHFIGERDWFDGLLESNCLVAPRWLLEQVGGFDESFDMPGGGYANLELYERLGAHPSTGITSIIGEGSFHQVHGGTTTNDANRDARRAKTFAYGEHYRELRGRELRGPAKNVEYVGAFTKNESRRTRSRRMTSMAFNEGSGAQGDSGIPTSPTPIPDELIASFTESLWHSLAWRNTSWLGTRLANAPTDLVVYQELLQKVRPDHVVVIAGADDGIATYLASICQLLDHGVVIAIGEHLDDTSPEAGNRIQTVHGAANEAATAAKVRAAVGDTPNGFVVFGGFGPPQPTVEAFKHYAELVPVGSYVVIENTIVNGHPVWPEHGPGPLEAIHRILTKRGDFMQDTEVERFGLTFNPGGFLRRVN